MKNINETESSKYNIAFHPYDNVTIGVFPVGKIWRDDLYRSFRLESHQIPGWRTNKSN